MKRMTAILMTAGAMGAAAMDNDGGDIQWLTEVKGDGVVLKGVKDKEQLVGDLIIPSVLDGKNAEIPKLENLSM